MVSDERIKPDMLKDKGGKKVSSHDLVEEEAAVASSKVVAVEKCLHYSSQKSVFRHFHSLQNKSARVIFLCQRRQICFDKCQFFMIVLTRK